MNFHPMRAPKPHFRHRKYSVAGFLSKGSLPSLSAIINCFSSEIRGHPHSASSPSERVFSMSLPRKAPLNTPGTPVLEDFPQNDDEKERLQRRRSRVLDLQFSADSPHLLASPSSRCVRAGLPPRGGRPGVGAVRPASPQYLVGSGPGV